MDDIKAQEIGAVAKKETLLWKGTLVSLQQVRQYVAESQWVYAIVSIEHTRVSVVAENMQRQPGYPAFLRRLSIIVNHLRVIATTNANLKGIYTIALNDTYLENELFPFPVLTPDKSPTCTMPVIPDFQLLQANNFLVTPQDSLLFSAKTPKLAFFGTSTGSEDSANNQRVAFCNFALKHRHFIDAYITNWTSYNHLRDDVRQRYGIDPCTISHEPVSIAFQMKYRYQLCIDGNSSCWHRLVWQLNSHSVVFMYEPLHHSWYYDLLKDKEHYLLCDRNNVLDLIEWANTNEKACLAMVHNANLFVSSYLTLDVQHFYLSRLLSDLSTCIVNDESTVLAPAKLKEADLNEGGPDTLRETGKIYKQLHDWQRAASCFDTMLALAKKTHSVDHARSALFHLAECELRLGNPASAHSLLKECLLVCPNHQGAAKLMEELISDDA